MGYDKIIQQSPFGDLMEAVRKHKESYRKAEPFPHCCLDNLVSDELLEEVLAEFPTPEQIEWRHLEAGEHSHNKLITTDAERQLGVATKYLINQLASPKFLLFLEELTGIQGLICDPYLHGGALHQIESGGFLGLHADFNWHPRLRLYRRLNLLLYLNKDWQEGYGGHLELWDEKLLKGEKYLPIWNRMIISSVTAKAYHGFPEAIKCPKEMTRKSLAIWFYTSELPAIERMDYYFNDPDWISHGRKKSILKRTVQQLLPPALVQLKKKARQTSSNVPCRFVPPIISYPLLRLMSHDPARRN